MPNKHIAEAARTMPVGTTGVAVAPWSDDEVYAVAANWAQASAPVYFYGDGEWRSRERQVADFRNPRLALSGELLNAIMVSAGCEGFKGCFGFDATVEASKEASILMDGAVAIANATIQDAAWAILARTDLTWHTQPRDQGQMVMVRYASDAEREVYYRDNGDGTVDACSWHDADDDFEPWNGCVPVADWEDVRVA